MNIAYLHDNLHKTKPLSVCSHSLIACIDSICVCVPSVHQQFLLCMYSYFCCVYMRMYWTMVLTVNNHKAGYMIGNTFIVVL